MPRFIDEELEKFIIDPREPAAWSRCPFCGADIVMGVRKDTRNITLAHSAFRDPSDASGTRYVSGCDRFTQALSRVDVIEYLFQAGARFQKLVSEGPG